MTSFYAMHRSALLFTVATAFTATISTGCGHPDTTSGATASGAHGPANITLRTSPDPATVGKNTFEVTVQAPNGSPVADAEVTLKYFMVGMPSMSNEVKLERAGNGRYTGSGDIQMAGSWELTVTARRDGQEVGNRKVTLSAK